MSSIMSKDLTGKDAQSSESSSEKQREYMPAVPKPKPQGFPVPMPGQDSLPPRPPSRRGRRPTPPALPPVTVTEALYHEALPGQSIPGAMTVAQLLQVVRSHSSTPSDSFLQLELRAKDVEGTGSGKGISSHLFTYLDVRVRVG